jgi:hypothetical protein
MTPKYANGRLPRTGLIALLLFIGLPFTLFASQLSPDENSLFTVILCLLLAGTVAGGGWIVSGAGGWSKLAKVYRAQQPFEGKKLTGRTVRLKALVAYKRIISLGAGRDGLSLEVYPLFRMGSPSLLIPWKDITKISEEQAFGYTWAVLQLAQVPDVPLRLRKPDVLALKEISESPNIFPGVS